MGGGHPPLCILSLLFSSCTRRSHSGHADTDKRCALMSIHCKAVTATPCVPLMRAAAICSAGCALKRPQTQGHTNHARVRCPPCADQTLSSTRVPVQVIRLGLPDLFLRGGGGWDSVGGCFRGTISSLRKVAKISPTKSRGVVGVVQVLELRDSLGRRTSSPPTRNFPGDIIPE